MKMVIMEYSTCLESERRIRISLISKSKNDANWILMKLFDFKIEGDTSSKK
jgi:hypothetical protein